MTHKSNTEPLLSLDIVLSVYNQEKIIQKILSGIFENTTTPFNLNMVFDGCTDATMPLALEYIASYRPTLLREVRTTTAPNVYETKANNIGFKMCTEKYLITLQDDMLIEEKGWEIRMTYPLRTFSDLFSVTARTALNIYFEKDSHDPIYIDRAERESFTLGRSTLALRSGINRGPVAFRTDILKQLGYLEEVFAPAQWDEFDLVLRAYEKFGLKSGVFQIDYRSDLAWGKTRQSETTMNTNSTYKKNVLLLRQRHPQLLAREGSIVENRRISSREIDYMSQDPVYTRVYKRMRSDLRHVSLFVRRRYIRTKHKLKLFILRTFKSKTSTH